MGARNYAVALATGCKHHNLRLGRINCVWDWLFEINGFPEWRSSEGGADKAVLFATGIWEWGRYI